MWPLFQCPLHMATVFLLFLVPTGKAFLRTIYNRHTTRQDFSTIPVFFRPPFPSKGPTGFLIEATPANVCHPLESLPTPSNNSTAVIALIHRSDGILGAQVPRYQGAILHNVNSQALVDMAIGSEEIQQQIKMPSVFIGEATSQHLRKACCPDEGAHLILVIEHYHFTWEAEAGNSCPCAYRSRIQLPGHCSSVPLLPVCRAISILVATVTGTVLIVKYTMRYHSWRMKRNLLSEEQGKKFHRSMYNKGARYTECAICLETYEKGDMLKILSCSHAYHGKCIDLWLLTQTKNKTCPLCMQRVIVTAESPDLDIVI